MSGRKLFKIISISKTKGSRISRSMTYADAMVKFEKYRKELQPGDTLYKIQVMEVAVGRAHVEVADAIEIEAPGWLQQCGVGG